MTLVLVLYDSRGGLIEQLAEAIEQGVIDGGADCARRRVGEAAPKELLSADGLIIGSPNWSGMTGKLKEWFDFSGDLWQTGDLAGKPAGAFTAGYSRSGGIEATLLQLMHLVLGHGMVFVGLPWSEAMRESGSYYGATAHGSVTETDRQQGHALGKRVAQVAMSLSSR